MTAVHCPCVTYAGVIGLMGLLLSGLLVSVIAVERAICDALTDPADVVIDIGRGNRDHKSS